MLRCNMARYLLACMGVHQCGALAKRLCRQGAGREVSTHFGYEAGRLCVILGQCFYAGVLFINHIPYLGPVGVGAGGGPTDPKFV